MGQNSRLDSKWLSLALCFRDAQKAVLKELADALSFKDRLEDGVPPHFQEAERPPHMTVVRPQIFTASWS